MTGVSNSVPRRGTALGWRLGAACLAWAAGWQPAAAQRIDVTPTLSVTETINERHRTAPENDRKVEAITVISPGITITSLGGPLRGSLRYSANAALYANESSRNRLTHALASQGQYSILDGRAGIDASASASQQIISAFGTQVADSTVDEGNQAQTFSYSISPYLTGRLLGNVNYQTRILFDETRTASGVAGSSSALTATAGLSGRVASLGWGLNASRQIVESRDRPRTHFGRVIGSLDYLVDVGLVVALRAGTDVQDVSTGQSQTSTSWGGAVNWRPDPRTSMTVDYDRRYFGNSHALVFSHRMARTVWTASDTRSVQIGGNRSRAEISTYDLFYAQFASIEPDPVRRDALVRAFLDANGLDAESTVVVGGFLTSAPAVQRRQQFAMSYQGIRTSFTVKAFNGRSSRLAAVVSAEDDFATTDRVRQRGIAVSVSHRLTSMSSFVVTGSQQHTSSEGALSGNDLLSLAATWTARLGQDVNVSLGVRLSQFDNDRSAYNESAVFGSVRMRF
jgi:uncharacterized protein (PEP-CTERM system associated)